MKKKNTMTLTQRISHFFKHYFLLLLMALGCSVMTVMLVALCAAV